MCSVRGPTSLGWCNFRNLSHEIVFSGLRARRVRRRVESIYSKRSEEPKVACQRKPTTPLALSSTERLHKKPFACLPTALRPSGPVQQWIFHQAEKELTTLSGLRYSSGHRKGRLKILSILAHVQTVLIVELSLREQRGACYGLDQRDLVEPQKLLRHRRRSHLAGLRVHGRERLD